MKSEVERLRELLRDVANSAPVVPDRRMGYVEVQIDWPVWDAVRETVADLDRATLRVQCNPSRENLPEHRHPGRWL